MTSAPSVLVVDDDETFRDVLVTELVRMNYHATGVGSASEAIPYVADRQPEIVLLDLRLPDVGGLEILRAIRARSAATDVIMLTGHGSIDTAIESIRMGAFDYVAKPCPLDELDLRMRRALEHQSLQRRTTLLERGLTPPDLGSAFIGNTPEFHRLLQLIERVGAADSMVLITGETGTGKEMVAKLLHARSPRRHRPFVVVECAALQETLLQSELFGHERGAFTGADRPKAGLFEVAHGGTIFLDEIGEVSHATQVKLLRVLDTSRFRHVGGTAEIHVDVRVLAATNRNLAEMVRQGLFRDDLYYRLATVLITVPPLRERRSDIDLLSKHFVRVFNQRFAVSRELSEDAAAHLRRHDWPGNVRELRHAIEAAMVVCEGAEIRPEHIPAQLSHQVAAAPAPADGGAVTTLEAMERAHIARALRTAEGHRGQAARMLGISERNLYRKLRAYGLTA